MPTSVSPKRNAKPQPQPPRSQSKPPQPRYLGPLLILLVLAAACVGLTALPASLVQRFLPPEWHASDFSGSLWHGSAGRLAFNSRDAGAVEWQVHPWPLLSLTLAGQLHWVKVGFVLDAEVALDRGGVLARDVVGGGPIEDLRGLGVAAGWRGTARFAFRELHLGFDAPAAAGTPAASAVGLAVRSVIGELDVSGLAAPQIAAGTDLGGYALRLAEGAVTPDAEVNAELTDTGGPLEVRAAIHFSAREHAGLLSGTVKERPQAPAALRSEMQQLTQLHARDAQGRIPVELEFVL